MNGAIDNNQLGEQLISAGLISEDELAMLLDIQRQSGEHLTRIVVERGIASEDTVLDAISDIFGLPIVSLRDFRLDEQASKLVDFRFASRHGLIPLSIEGDLLRIAVTTPLDVQAMDDLRLLTGYLIECVLARESEILAALRTTYGVGAETIRVIMESGEISSKSIDSEQIDIGEARDSAGEASIIGFVNQILAEAVGNRATDVHIEPYPSRLRVRYRIDGVLHELPVPANLHHFHEEIISRVKVMSNLNIAERRLPQDGRCTVRVDRTNLDLRISILPTAHGETVSIRFLNRGAILFGLDRLGLSQENLQIFERMIHRPYGIILVTGPTGSGKTTTLYSCLNRINSSDRKIITIEDPIEYQLTGISQIQVHPKIGLTFGQGLRSMLRHDPDIMMVGEIRDSETAQVAVQIALTGHLIFSSLHTNDSASTIVRLRNMGVESYLIVSSVECIIAQRLVRLVCRNCSEEMPVDPAILVNLTKQEREMLPDRIIEGRGCSACNGTGFFGRTGIFETLVLNEGMRWAVMQHMSSGSLKNLALEHGMRTLRIDGFEKVRQGLTTLSEVLRVTLETDDSAKA
ncbi:MAG: ATPase, T2SS/T4P/T4SS family [Candidatus Zixiibacteriota bacterium]